MTQPSRRRPRAWQSPGGRTPSTRPTTSRSTSRPAQQRRRPAAMDDRRKVKSAGKVAGNSTRSRGRLTGRAAVLGLAVCAIVLTLAYPMREYLAQRSQIAQLTEQEQTQRAKVAALEEQRRRWEDPAYVRAQARQRLQYVMPGEVGYVVVNPEQVRKNSPPSKSPIVSPAGAGKDAPWYSQLWGTVPAADSAK